MAKKKAANAAHEIYSGMEENANKLKFKFSKLGFAFTKKQQTIVKAIKDPHNKIVFVDGPAGTGKSLIAVYCALKMLKEEKVDGILYLRTAVESASKSLGYLKGDLDEKFSVYRKILDDKIIELIDPTCHSEILTSQCLEALPINYVRGNSWRNKIVILDEHQNVTIDEAKTLLTRVGEGSKLVMCGDMQQMDIGNSGIKYLKEIFDSEDSREMGIQFYQLNSDDIVRSEIVKFVVKKFEEMDSKSKKNLTYCSSRV